MSKEVMVFYFESGRGCGLRESKSLEQAKREILHEVGTYEGVTLVQEATDENIGLVLAMGGFVPESKRSKRPNNR